MREERKKERKKKRVADRFHHVRQGRNILTGPVMYSPLSLSLSPESVHLQSSVCNVLRPVYNGGGKTNKQPANSRGTIDHGFAGRWFPMGNVPAAAATAAHNKQHGVEQTIKKRRKKNWNGKAQKLDNNAEERGGIWTK
jgi:hypothetical protein